MLRRFHAPQWRSRALGVIGAFLLLHLSVHVLLSFSPIESSDNPGVFTRPEDRQQKPIEEQKRELQWKDSVYQSIEKEKISVEIKRSLDEFPKFSECWNRQSHGPRNYMQFPVLVQAQGLVKGHSPTRETCDLPCFSTANYDVGARFDAIINFDLSHQFTGTTSCNHQRKAFLSMESPDIYPRNRIPSQNFNQGDLLMTVELRSNVTAGYYSWVEYAIMDPPDLKAKEIPGDYGHAAAFISNCGIVTSNRTKLLEELVQHGIKLDSYGRCMNNKREPQGGKVNVLKNYKFGIAMENSIWDDYTTEKLFQVYEAGAIPIVVGAPNSKQFEPLKGSMVFLNDYPTVADAAKHILEISKNETLFRHYLRYKWEGPSDEFLALYDISAVHSRCRMCIKMADLMDLEFGEFFDPESAIPQDWDKLPGKFVRVRERNRYFFRTIYFSELTIDGLRSALLTSLQESNHSAVWKGNRPSVLDRAWRLYRIYRFWPQMTMWDTLHNQDIFLESDFHVQNLHHLQKIEFILV